MTLTVADGVLTVIMDSAGLPVRAVELRLTLDGEGVLTLAAPGDVLGPGALAEAVPVEGGLTLALARVGVDPSGPVDGVLARVRAAGTGAVRVAAQVLDDALEPLYAIAAAQVALAP